MKRVVIAMDSFKEALDSYELGQVVAKNLGDKFQTEVIELADGGEGTMVTLTNVLGGEFICVNVQNPIGEEIVASFGYSKENETAIIDIASASGLALLNQKEQNPLNTSSYGTGQLIKEALNCDIKKMIIGLGGSATSDLGLGILEALGAKFYDDAHNLVIVNGRNLKAIKTIDLSGLDPRLKQIDILLATDVNNPLLGSTGANYIYAPQKGATSGEVLYLEKEFERLSKILQNLSGCDLTKIIGGGAAGGSAATLNAVLGAEIKNGSQVINTYTNLEAKIKASDIVITGEGRFDLQSLYGKGPMEVIKLAQKYQKKVIVIAGSVDIRVNEHEELNDVVILPSIMRIDNLENTIFTTKESVGHIARNIAKLL